MSQPGFKVIHVPDVDFESSCLSLKECLTQVANWSRAHPAHLPLILHLSLDSRKTAMPGATSPLPFDGTAMAALEKEIGAVFRTDEIITPLAVRGGRANLRQAVLSHAWPGLDASAGKIVFVLSEPGAPSPPSNLVFRTEDEHSPDAAFVAIEDPLKDQDRIKSDVKAGFIVITRADSGAVEARRHDARRRDAAFASGAQVIETNFLIADRRIGAYQASIPGRHATCDAASADCTVWNAAQTASTR
jgi:hypothetical protein